MAAFRQSFADAGSAARADPADAGMAGSIQKSWIAARSSIL